jgi:hypothetical protein
MKKLAESDLTHFYLRHVVIIVTAVTMISLSPVNTMAKRKGSNNDIQNITQKTKDRAT